MVSAVTYLRWALPVARSQRHARHLSNPRLVSCCVGVDILQLQLCIEVAKARNTTPQVDILQLQLCGEVTKTRNTTPQVYILQLQLCAEVRKTRNTTPQVHILQL